MADGAVIANAYLNLIPSMKGSQGIIAKEVAKDIGGAEAVAETVGAKSGSKFSTALLSRAKGLVTTAAVTGVATGLYKIGETFDDLEDTIRTGTGASGKALDGLVDVAKRVGSNVPVSFDKIGPVVADLNTRLGLSGSTLEKVASQYLEAGRILGQDVDIQKTTAAFSAFHIEGEAVEGAMDSLFRVSQATGVGMNDLASSISQFAPAMQNLGFSFDETAALIGGLDKAGINSTQTMSAMQKGLITMAKSGEKPKETFKRVTGEIESLVKQGKSAEAIKLASGIFGTRGAAAFVGAVQSGKFAIDDLTGSIGQSNDTILGVADETSDFAEKWQLVKNNAQLALEPLGSAVFSALADVFGKLIEPMKAFGKWMQENPEATKVMVAVLGTLAAGLGAAKLAMLLFNSALLTSPITWIIVGITALVAAIVALWQNWDQVVAWIKDIGSKFAEWWSNMWDSVKQWVSDVWNGIVDWVKRAWRAVVDFVVGLGQGFAQWWVDLWNGFTSWVSSVWQSIVNVVTGAWDGVVNFIVGVGRTLAGWWDGLWNWIGRIISNAWHGILDFIKGIPGRILGLLSRLGELGWRAAEWFGAFAHAAWQKFVDVLKFIAGIPGNILRALGNLGNLLWNAGRNLIMGFVRGIMSAFGKVRDALGWLTDRLTSWKGPPKRDAVLLKPAGQMIIEGFVAGLESRYGAVQSSLAELTSDLSDMALDVTPAVNIDAARARAVNRSFQAGVGMYGGEPSEGAGGIHFHIGSINNPQAEPTSTSLSRELQRAASGVDSMV